MADQYRKFEISPITPAQALTIRGFYDILNKAEASICLFEYNASTQTLTISFGGADLTNLLTRVRTFFQNRAGRLPDVDVSIQPGDKLKTKEDLARDRGKVP